MTPTVSVTPDDRAVDFRVTVEHGHDLLDMELLRRGKPGDRNV
jgi:hypothetical protein